MYPNCIEDLEKFMNFDNSDYPDKFSEVSICWYNNSRFIVTLPLELMLTNIHTMDHSVIVEKSGKLIVIPYNKITHIELR